jgi:prepilin-type N-terminal cleavage/methylation domain-containing protein
MKKKGFTLIELLVVIAIIAMLLAILMPALNKVKKIAQRVICGTNLKGLGTAQTVYANDYDDEYVVQGRGFAHTWTPGTKAAPTGSVGTMGWQNLTTNITTQAGTITIGASLYLLVREADVSPKSFVCPSSGETVFSGKNANNLDITALFDFGNPQYTPTGGSPEGPAKCVSYSYQMPYAAGQTPMPTGANTGSKGKYAATGGRSASFAVMADKNPWYDTKIPTNGGATSTSWMEIVTWIGGPTPIPAGGDWTNIEKWRIAVANAQPHDREGQNVTYADGHNAWETRADVSTKNDYIYAPWANLAGTESDRRRSVLAATTTPAPLSTEDSVLVNDL